MTMEKMIHYKEQILEIEQALIDVEKRISKVRTSVQHDLELSDTEQKSIINLSITIGLRASVKARIDTPGVQEGLTMLREAGYESIDDVPVEMLPSIFMGAMERFIEFDHKQTDLDDVEP